MATNTFKRILASFDSLWDFYVIHLQPTSPPADVQRMSTWYLLIVFVSSKLFSSSIEGGRELEGRLKNTNGIREGREAPNHNSREIFRAIPKTRGKRKRRTVTTIMLSASIIFHHASKPRTSCKDEIFEGDLAEGKKEVVFLPRSVHSLLLQATGCSTCHSPISQ